ncbi:4-hydroxy-3-methylbut-2-enyl diphosphate reductase [Hippea maritima]|uniref:4-hydroxy-3-methylbut-2-enyl diphosphate reductase n=1 Tax=Hippea maritima (strain ATCC 700847 / DSM 10411 / MH2) TaxID=760142 RepID=F2LW74_HIPMA|nr:4-hydroxy-3-methylbut-2-enyl diphosphate reductase [Hippea maritima]AEA34008.1 4-hydroxy-3-methylbut-2-enyl diphosphate reductase [Hippea maritima DSM 10411]
MKIEIAENAGFCYGVMRAIEIANRALKEYKSLYSFGPIIHNPQVVEEYEKKGLKVIETLDEADGPVLIRSHGVPPKVYEDIEKRGLKVIDATCPFVKEAQRYAKQLYDEGYKVVIFGDNEHPEVKAHLGYTNYTASVINSPKTAASIKASRVGVVCQTTQSVERFGLTIGELAKRIRELKVFNTICDATEKRQEAAKELAKRSDIMIVIGGKNSANTRKLYEICKENSRNAYHIETEIELEKNWFDGIENIGITAGASTPSYIIERVYKAIRDIVNG